MNKTIAYGYVEDGKLHLINKRRLTADLSQFKNGDIQLIIKRRGKRSLPQNAYYWGVIVEEIRLNLLERGNRFDADDIHEYLKLKFNYETVVVNNTGELLQIGRTTTELNKDEFGVYIDRIISWCSETLGIVVPMPNTQTVLEYFK